MKTSPTQHTIDLGSEKIPYLLHRTGRKYLRIVISPELKVDVFAPNHVSSEQLQSAMTRKTRWIVKTLAKLKNLHPLPMPKKYQSGETIAYLGRRYRLEVENGADRPAKLSGGFLRVRVGDRTDVKSVKRSVEAWYRKRASETLNRYLEKCYPVVSPHGIPAPEVSLRVMRRRWGSCSSSGRITLNARLVMVPVHCIEYVVIHELCHLKNHDHSKAFYSLLARCLPDWRRRKETLDRFRLC